MAEDVEGRQEELVERFVEGALARKVDKDYPGDKAQHWLSFLASRMTQRNKMIFELRDLQYDWWKWGKMQKALITVIEGLSLTLASNLALWVIIVSVRLLNGQDFVNIVYTPLIYPLCFTIVLIVTGLVFGTLRANLPLIKTKENVNWSWKKFMPYYFKNQGFFLLGLALGFLFVYFRKGGLREINFNLLIFISLLSLFFTINALSQYVDENSSSVIQITTPYQRFHFSNSALYFSILQHRHLCKLLRKQNLLPPNLPAFFNEFSARHILETDGATWRFRHRILQERFADRWVEE